MRRSVLCLDQGDVRDAANDQMSVEGAGQRQRCGQSDTVGEARVDRAIAADDAAAIRGNSNAGIPTAHGIRQPRTVRRLARLPPLNSPQTTRQAVVEPTGMTADAMHNDYHRQRMMLKAAETTIKSGSNARPGHKRG